MKYEEFIEKIKNLNLYRVATERDWDHQKSRGCYLKNKNPDSLDNEKPFVVFSSGNFGGYEGGSCWDSSNPHAYTNSSGLQECNDGINKILTDILEEVCPDISLIKYNKIYHELIKEYEYTEAEYYGNSNDYLVKYIELQELYDRLIEHKII